MTTVTTRLAEEAATAIEPYVVRTPSISSEALNALVGAPIVAKAESLQLTGSFKVRGALNKIRTLSDRERNAGLITVSAGNAALGVAYAAMQLGASLTVVMPQNAVSEKLAAVAAYGAHIVKDGITSASEAFDRAAALQAAENLTFVHPFDDPHVIAGAATVTMELLEAHPNLAQLFVPCSGGGLLAGAILAAEVRRSTVRIIGVQPDGADGLVRSLAAGHPVAPPSISSIADGLTAPRPGALNFTMISRANIEVVTVSDDQILAAMRALVMLTRLIVEPSGAAGLAGLLSHPYLRVDGQTGVILSGSNVSWELLRQVLL